MWIVELAQIFSCFDVNMVILEKCGILYGDDKEVIKSKIGEYFGKKTLKPSININNTFVYIGVLRF